MAFLGRDLAGPQRVRIGPVELEGGIVAIDHGVVAARALIGCDNFFAHGSILTGREDSIENARRRRQHHTRVARVGSRPWKTRVPVGAALLGFQSRVFEAISCGEGPMKGLRYADALICEFGGRPPSRP